VSNDEKDPSPGAYAESEKDICAKEVAVADGMTRSKDLDSVRSGRWGATGCAVCVDQPDTTDRTPTPRTS